MADHNTAFPAPTPEESLAYARAREQLDRFERVRVVVRQHYSADARQVIVEPMVLYDDDFQFFTDSANNEPWHEDCYGGIWVKDGAGAALRPDREKVVAAASNLRYLVHLRNHCGETDRALFAALTGDDDDDDDDDNDDDDRASHYQAGEKGKWARGSDLVPLFVDGAWSRHHRPVFGLPRLALWDPAAAPCEITDALHAFMRAVRVYDLPPVEMTFDLAEPPALPSRRHCRARSSPFPPLATSRVHRQARGEAGRNCSSTASGSGPRNLRNEQTEPCTNQPRGTVSKGQIPSAYAAQTIVRFERT